MTDQTGPTKDEREAASFTGTSGRTWQLELDGGKARTIQETLGIHINDLMFGMGRVQLAIDFDKLNQFLWIVCEAQADAAGVTPEDFPRELGPDQMQRIGGAIEQALANFCPAGPARRAMEQAMEQERQLEDLIFETQRGFHGKQMEKARQTLGTLELEEIESLIYGSSPINSPQSAGSTRAP